MESIGTLQPSCNAPVLTLTVTLAMVLNIMNVMGVLIALPTIGAELSINVIDYQWLISAYSLAFGSCLLLFGRLADL